MPMDQAVLEALEKFKAAKKASRKHKRFMVQLGRLYGQLTEEQQDQYNRIMQSLEAKDGARKQAAKKTASDKTLTAHRDLLSKEERTKYDEMEADIFTE